MRITRTLRALLFLPVFFWFSATASFASGLSVWKSIELGRSETNVHGFRAALARMDMRIGGYASEVLDQVETRSDMAEVALFKVSPADLGFDENPSLREFYDRAFRLGLKRCSPEVGPQLRLQYDDQPKHEHLRVAMDPIMASDGMPSVFGIQHDFDGYWLLLIDIGAVDSAEVLKKETWIFCR